MDLVQRRVLAELHGGRAPRPPRSPSTSWRSRRDRVAEPQPLGAQPQAGRRPRRMACSATAAAAVTPRAQPQHGTQCDAVAAFSVASAAPGWRCSLDWGRAACLLHFHPLSLRCNRPRHSTSNLSSVTGRDRRLSSTMATVEQVCDPGSHVGPPHACASLSAVHILLLCRRIKRARWADSLAVDHARRLA